MVLTISMNSVVLGCATRVTITIPDAEWGKTAADHYKKDEKFKVLWLLHGAGGNDADWIRMTSIERYANDRRMMVVMPDGRNSGYDNEPGYPMWDFMNDELMPMIYAWFPASEKREDNYVAGLSMGGFGTCRWAFKHSEKFQGMAALSCGPFSVMRLITGEMPIYGRAGFIAKYHGNVEEARPYDLWEMAAEMMERKDPVPKMYFAAGTEDPLHTADDMALFEEYAKTLGLEARYEAHPGTHDWAFWDEHIQRALAYFFDE